MKIAAELNDFRFRLNQEVGQHVVAIICEPSDKVLSTKIVMEYYDEEFDLCTHTILVDYVPLHLITDLMATITAQVEKARKQLIILKPYFEQHHVNYDELKDVVNWSSMLLAEFFCNDVLINARKLLKSDICDYRLPYDTDEFKKQIAAEQTVIELPVFFSNHSVIITIETDRPFGEIKLAEDFNYTISKMRIEDKNLTDQKLVCNISAAILEQLNTEMDMNWAIQKTIRKNLFAFPSTPKQVDTSDLPF